MQDFDYVARSELNRHISMHGRDGLDPRIRPCEREQQRQSVIDASIGIDDNPLHRYYFATGASVGAAAGRGAAGGLSVRVRPSGSVTETKMPPGSPLTC